MELPEGQDEPKGTEQDDPNTTEENEESDINSETGAPGDPVEPETDTSTEDPQVEDGPQNESVDGKEKDIQKSDLSEENGNESPEASANVEEGCQDGDLSEESGKENPEEAGGPEDCRAAMLFGGNSNKLCTFACIGMGNCARACQFDAMHIIDGVARVDRFNCVGCGACVDACPKSGTDSRPFLP